MLSVRNHLQKILVNARVVAQFRMERRRQRLAFAQQHRIFTFRRDHFHALAYAFNLRSADEYHLDGLGKKSAFADGAVDLASVSISAHGDVEGPQARLPRILHVGCQQDASSARTEGWLHAHEIFQFRESVFAEQLKKCPRLATGDYQTVDLVELLGLLDEHNFGSQLFEPFSVGFEIALT